MSADREPASVELLDVGVDEVDVTEQTVVRGSASSNRRWLLGGLVVISLLLATLWWTGARSQDQVEPAAPGADGQTVLDKIGAADGAGDGDGVGERRSASPFGEPASPAQALTFRLSHLDGRLDLVMASPIGITVWDLIGDQSSIVSLPERPVGAGLAPVGDRLVYVGQTSAWAITEEGLSQSLGSADEVLAAGDPQYVWLGRDANQEGRGVYFDWREVDANGVERRQTRREMPMEFNTPDLVWGFESSLFRLTDDEDRPWRLVAYGLPLAVGRNDLIVKTCDPGCRSVWFDAGSGADRGSLLADIAGRFDGQGGWLSPDGRFLAHQRGSTAPVRVLSLGRGEWIDVDCRSARDVVWAAAGFLACGAEDGVAIVDLESGGTMTVVPPADLLGLALWERS